MELARCLRQREIGGLERNLEWKIEREREEEGEQWRLTDLELSKDDNAAFISLSPT
jgi:hypothetical protein